MQETIRVGLIGCGVIAGNHLASLDADPRASVVAVADPDRARAVQLVGDRPIAIEPDHQALLARDDIDLVHILTPHSDHVAHLEAAVAAGKHVICEKPLATTPEHLAAMVVCEQRAVAAGLVTACIFQHRTAPVAQALYRLLVEDRAFGAITGGHLAFQCTRTEAYYAKDAWRGTWAAEGGGLLINQAIHALDLLVWFSGSVPASVAVTVARERLPAPVEVEDRADGRLVLPSGAALTIAAVNDGIHGWDHTIELVGERGRVRYTTNQGGAIVSLEHPDPAVVAALEAAAAGEESPATALVGKDCYGNHHATQISQTIDAILGGQRPPVTIADGATANEVVLACYHSTAIGAPAALPLTTYHHPQLALPNEASA